MRSDTSKPSTIALHADRHLETNHGIAPPISQSVTYFADDAGDFAYRATEPLFDAFYGRHGNPTSSRIAQVIADLEGGEAAMMFGSGMAAISTSVLAHLRAGDHVVAQTNHYIGTTHLVEELLPRFGVEVTRVDQRSTEAFERALRPTTKLFMVETPVNPTMHLTDLQAVATLAKAHGITTICDNTFATPINQRPIALGIDLVCHSVTKYIGGHHDLLAGAVVGSRASLQRVWDSSMTIGALSAPFNSWLALRGVRTLPLRVARHNANAMAVARFLSDHPAVAEVMYPGLESNPQHELAASQMSGFGGLLSFDLRGGYDA
ncbi:MAG: PLP-dependent aspartate aminotransferase family protein, partial [Myxococcota bacterium]